MFNELDFDTLDKARSENSILNEGICDYVILDFKSLGEKTDPKTNEAYSSIMLKLQGTDSDGNRSKLNGFISTKSTVLWALRAFLISAGLYKAKKEGWLDYKYLVGREGKFINQHKKYTNDKGLEVDSNEVKSFDVKDYNESRHQYTREELEVPQQTFKPLTQSSYINVPDKVEDELPF